MNVLCPQLALNNRLHLRLSLALQLKLFGTVKMFGTEKMTVHGWISMQPLTQNESSC